MVSRCLYGMERAVSMEGIHYARGYAGAAFGCVVCFVLGMYKTDVLRLWVAFPSGITEEFVSNLGSFGEVDQFSSFLFHYLTNRCIVRRTSRHLTWIESRCFLRLNRSREAEQMSLIVCLALLL